MVNENYSIKERILQQSVALFSEKGYHGTSMREIAAKAECSMPMLYYYYKNKEELFYALAYSEFVELIEKLNTQVKRGQTLIETYFNAIQQRKELSAYDKAVYKLSLKAWFGFEDHSKVREDILAWEGGRLDRTQKLFSASFEDKDRLAVFSNVLVRVMENIIEKIILFDEDISDEQIKKELDYLYHQK